VHWRSESVPACHRLQQPSNGSAEAGSRVIAAEELQLVLSTRGTHALKLDVASSAYRPICASLNRMNLEACRTTWPRMCLQYGTSLRCGSSKVDIDKSSNTELQVSHSRSSARGSLHQLYSRTTRIGGEHGRGMRGWYIWRNMRLLVITNSYSTAVLWLCSVFAEGNCYTAVPMQP
jgi:hypothetical protein